MGLTHQAPEYGKLHQNMALPYHTHTEILAFRVPAQTNANMAKYGEIPGNTLKSPCFTLFGGFGHMYP